MTHSIQIKDRIKQGTTTAGVGTLSLDITYSSSGFQDFSVLGNGVPTYYAIEESPNQWEVGIGTYSSSTLTRDTILDSSNGGDKISLGGSGLVFVTYPAVKSVFEDTDKNIHVTGVVVGVTGVKFSDGTIQTTAAQGYDWIVADGAGNNETIGSGDTVYWSGVGATDVTYDTATNIISISGGGGGGGDTYYDGTGLNLDPSTTFNVSGATIDNSGIAQLTNTLSQSSGLAATPYLVSGVSGVLQSEIDSQDGRISSNTSTILGHTINIANNQTNISSNDTDIATVSGLLYNYWTVSDGSTTENIAKEEQVTFTGEDNTTVSYDPSSNTVTISGTSVGGYDWNVADGNGNSELVGSGDTVYWSGIGGTDVTYSSSTNIVSISGYDSTYDAGTGLVLDPSTTFNVSGATIDNSGIARLTNAVTDSSGLAVTPYAVSGVSGDLQSNINVVSSIATTNLGSIITNISNISTNTSNISTNTTNISTNDTDISNLSGLVATNTTDISTNDTDISNLSGLVSANDADITTVSGLLYNHWTITDGTNTENITKEDQVKFTGIGTSLVSYDTSSNTVTVSGGGAGAGGYDWNVADGNGNSELIASGNTVYFSGDGLTDVTYDSATNIISVSGSEYDWNVADGNGNSEAVSLGDTVYFSGVDGAAVDYDSATNVVSISGSQGVSRVACRMLATGVTSVPEQTSTQISLDTIDYQYGSISGTISNDGRIYLLESGVYLINAQVQSSGNNSVRHSAEVEIWKNGAEMPAGQSSYTVSSDPATYKADNPTRNASVVVTGVSGDYYDVRLWHDASSSTAADTTMSDSCWLSVVKLEGTKGDKGDQGPTGGIAAYYASKGLYFDPVTTFNVSGTTIDNSGMVQLTNIISQSSGLAMTPYGVSGVSGALQSDIDTNTTNISTNTTNISTNDTDISNLSGLVSTNTTNISTNDTDISNLSGLVSTNTTNISTNDTDISNLSGLVYDYWTVQGDSADTGNVDNAEVVQFTGAGNVSVTLGSPDNRTVTISGNDVTNAYTANTGLVLIGSTEFNTSGTGNFDQLTFTNDRVRIGTNTSDSGTFPIAIGHWAGDGSNGNYANLVGYYAGYHATGSSAHTQMFGTYAGRYTNNCDYTNFIGYEAGNSAERIDTSNVIGYRAGKNAEDHDNVNMIGTEAGRGSIFSDKSNMLGYRAGYDSSGENNHYIGYQAGYKATGTKNIEIVTFGPNPSIIGDNDYKLHIDNTIIGDMSSKKLAIGDVSASNLNPDATLEILPRTGTDVGIIVQPLDPNPTANLTEWQSGDATILAKVTSEGCFSGQCYQFSDGTSQTTASTYNAGTGLNLDPSTTFNVSGSTVLDSGIVQLTNTITDSSGLAATPYAVSGVSGALQSAIDTNGTDINTVSGLLYNHWTISDGANSENITKEDQVNFTGGGNTTVSYDTASNTVTVSGTSAGGYDWTIADGDGNSEVIPSGDTIYFSGVDGTDVSYDTATNIVSISGAAGSSVAGDTTSRLVSTSSTTSIPEDTWTEIGLDTLGYEAGNISGDIVNGRVYLEESGLYLISAQGSIDTQYNITNWVIGIRKNGLSQNIDDIGSAAGQRSYNEKVLTNWHKPINNASVVTTGISGDYFSVYGWQENNAYITARSTELNTTWISVTKLGAGKGDKGDTGPAGAGGAYDWNVADGNGNSETVSSGDTVYWSGVDGTSVTYDTATNIFSIAGGSSSSTSTGNVSCQLTTDIDTTSVDMAATDLVFNIVDHQIGNISGDITSTGPQGRIYLQESGVYLLTSYANFKGVYNNSRTATPGGLGSLVGSWGMGFTKNGSHYRWSANDFTNQLYTDAGDIELNAGIIVTGVSGDYFSSKIWQANSSTSSVSTDSPAFLTMTKLETRQGEKGDTGDSGPTPHYANLRQSSSQSVTNMSWTKIEMDTTEEIYGATTGNFGVKIERSGLYQINYQLGMQANEEGEQHFISVWTGTLSDTINADVVIGYAAYTIDGTASNMYGSHSMQWNLPSGVYVYAGVWFDDYNAIGYSDTTTAQSTVDRRNPKLQIHEVI